MGCFGQLLLTIGISVRLSSSRGLTGLFENGYYNVFRKSAIYSVEYLFRSH